jgi:hypothetical protein
VAETRFFDTGYANDTADFEAVETADNDEMYLAGPNRSRRQPVSEHSPKGGKGKGKGKGKGNDKNGGGVGRGHRIMGSMRAPGGAAAASPAAGGVGKKPRKVRSFDKN